MKRILCLLALAGTLTGLSDDLSKPNHTFQIGEESFLLDGKPFRIRCGEIHFARIPKPYWRHRIQMCKAMGLNAVCIYLFWNYHEGKPGVFDFSGEKDAAQFCRIAQEEGMWLLLRPGPYSCAEWEYGGLPWWLLDEGEAGVRVRSTDPKFLKPAKRYLEEVGKVLAPLQVTRGGPILMVQVENEYGSYAKDAEYMRALYEATRAAGFEVPLFACNGPNQLPNGRIPELFDVVNFGGDPAGCFKELRKYRKTGPLMNGEYYPGWFDTWGAAHHTKSAKGILGELGWMLEHQASFSIYMAHGGTTFGWWAGCNSPYHPQTSSYDYEAPISEAGHATEKFYGIRELCAKHLEPGEKLPAVPAAIPVAAFEASASAKSAGVDWSKPRVIAAPCEIERLGLGYGIVKFTHELPPGPNWKLSCTNVRDHAAVRVDGKLVGFLDRRYPLATVTIPPSAGPRQLEIILEPMGRINFGSKAMPFAAKGILAPVMVDGRPLKGDWLVSTCEFAKLSEGGALAGKEVTTLKFTARAGKDCWLDVRGWNHGLVWLNDHPLGRYWAIGPTQTMFVPGCWLKEGENKLVVWDLKGFRLEGGKLKFLDHPILDELHPELDLLKANSEQNLKGDDSAAEQLSTATLTKAKKSAASIRETTIDLMTYPFSDPDPVPATSLVRYPYFFFDGTTSVGQTQTWKAVVLENDRIKVTMFPEIGGKVWGAVDKQTDREFIYFNHVVKFRNISQRGPWCSGGIEFNFGTIGHGPWTATPVAYFTRRNPDGSVSYFCSETELATLATWQVEVRLAPGADHFTTRTIWYNGSGFPGPYYQWMNAAYSTRGDPTFIFPGKCYIGHNGDSHAWPVDPEGHNLAHHDENAFGSAKSEHVLNGNNGFYGIWWPARDGQPGFGSAHVNRVTEKYGRKLWLWPLSRNGAIWEDLLTDTDGQYTELQSGRAFNQPEGSLATPFKNPTFAAGATETFEESWHAVRDERFFVAHTNLADYVERPQNFPTNFNWESAYGHYLKGEQLLRARRLRKGVKELEKSLECDQFFLPTLSLMALEAARTGAFAQTHEYAARALAINTYDPAANYAEAMAFLGEGKLRAAKERFGLAAYSPEFRSAAFVEVARLEMREGDFAAAADYVDKALAANALNLDARLLEIALARRHGDKGKAARLAARLLTTLPLLHQARYELNELRPKTPPMAKYVRGEFPEEVYLGIGENYEKCGLDGDAIRFFRLAGKNTPIGLIRLAYLEHLRGKAAAAMAALDKAIAMPVEFALPHRLGTLAALQWACSAKPNWKLHYYQGVLLAALTRDAEAGECLERCADEPDTETFYLYRASFRSGDAALKDLKRAAGLQNSWRTGFALYSHFKAMNDAEQALAVLEPYVKRTPSNKINIAYANALVAVGRHEEAIKFLENTEFLPSENGDDANGAWMTAWIKLGEAALARGDRAAAKAAAEAATSYPERLGKGRPYDLDFSPRKGNPLSEMSAELRALLDSAK